MTTITELLYLAWIGPANPAKWPEYLQNNPVEAQGRYAFAEGLRLGLQLAAEAFYSDADL